jgi:enolase-phosphatase E1
MKTFLFDIEGTTTDIHFVHKVLFPYSKEKLEDFVKTNPKHPAVLEVQEKLKTNSLSDVISQFKTWIAEDKKEPALKQIQGDIWQTGYETGDFKGHVYEDVLPFWKRCLELGHQISIYSSGSVKAQKLIFGYSDFGDLKTHISHYFDTSVGHKREVESYLKIRDSLKTEIIFFSDIAEELDAAKAAGLETIHVLRDGLKASTHPTLQSFNEYSF